jgi:hypothetical protein
LHNMADIGDMVDELTDKAKKGDRADRDTTATINRGADGRFPSIRPRPRAPRVSLAI